jgi:hypothetical protein
LPSGFLRGYLQLKDEVNEDAEDSEDHEEESSDSDDE